MSRYLAAYDVSSTRRRATVALVLTSYGMRIQQSVFELWLEPHEVVELRGKVGALLDPTDAFDLVPIDEHGTRPRYRWQRPPEPGGPILLR